MAFRGGALVLLTLFYLAPINTLQAQEATHHCAAAKKPAFAHTHKPSAPSVLADQYDVQYVKLDLSVTNQNTAISGTATTRATVTAGGMSAYVFELIPGMVITSATFNGTSVSVTGAGDVRTITLPAPLPAGANFEVAIQYAGTSAGEPGSFPKGLSNMISPSWGNRVTFTLSEAYSAKDWWPAKQSLTDKIDSCDIWITVPGNLKAGSNGVLTGVMDLPGGKKQFRWKNRAPIDYYLISFAVAQYVDYSFYQPLDGGDSVLLQNYVYDNPATLPFYKLQIDSVGRMLSYYSQLFGRYPFWQEKYGHCMAPINGGMEHQTMTTLGNFNTGLSAHELVHQWFGDYVTCGSWSDIWLNEGFAGYGEYLFLDHFHGAAAAAADMTARHNRIMTQPGGSVHVSDTLDEDRLFDSRLTYDKGAAVVHMLRYLANDDALFYSGLRQYLNTFQNSTARTADLKAILSAAYSLDLDTFFQRWIYGEGYPTFSAEWHQADGIVTVAVSQTTSVPGSVPYFVTPVDVQLQSPAGDTIVRLPLHHSSDLFHIAWNKPMTGLTIDPQNWVLNGVGTIIKNPAVTVAALPPTAGITVHPNPTTAAWQITEIPDQSVLRLYNAHGQLLWQQETGKQHNVTIPASGLPSGVYILSLQSAARPTIYRRLIRG